MLDRKALEGLPLRLLIVSLLMSLSLPVVLENLGEFERRADLAQMESEAAEIKRVAEMVFQSGPGNARTLSIDLKPSSSICIGGDANSSDSLSIRCCYHGEEMAIEWLDSPVFHLVFEGNETLRISGHCQLVLTSILMNGNLGVAAEVIG